MSNEKRFEVEEVVAEEYQYVAQTAFQAQEDRARVTTFLSGQCRQSFWCIFWNNTNNRTNNAVGFHGIIFISLLFWDYHLTPADPIKAGLV